MIFQRIKKIFILSSVFFCVINTAIAQDVAISINANQNKKAVSPYIYGLNNSFDKPAQFYKDAGLRFSRMNGGNNATKYNWRKKISSHPDWYNNVYSNDWDKTSKEVTASHPTMQLMYAFQLLGRVASSTAHNFNDWGYNNSNWWEGVHQNLAGGGVPNEANPGGDALVEGDVNLYTQEWPADSTVEILNHWFGPDGLGLNNDQFRYWSMDNEADVWNGTHDDVMSDGLLPAAEFMDKFIEVAKKARALFPGIKICGPVTTSEWQWYIWGEESIMINGKYYSWFEYFIKRCADEEKESGIRVLDVLDIHHYPWAPTDNDALQNHRIFYDKNYVYPGANGIKTINGGWDNSQNKEFIFTRIEDWLDQHFGEGHGITLALSEWSPGPDEPNLASVIYATHLGLFANNGVEFFTPWTWFTGMWESLHLFSRYAKGFSVSSTSSLENKVSAYTTVNEASDSMTVIIVNRDMVSEQNVTVNIDNFAASDRTYKTLQLSSLPAAETFKSHTNNALKENEVSVESNSFTITVPALSTTAVLLQTATLGKNDIHNKAGEMKVFPNPANNELYISMGATHAGPTHIRVFDQQGRTIKVEDTYHDGRSAIRIDISSLRRGYYFLSAQNNHHNSTKSFVVKR
ncbi:MAG: T9SS type A sorting domain-containing protein [Prolixibacteraceae bacterium]|nr:T9SS type A sorting domain-containing protein [Prolixibacteraceae bacterium]